MKYLQIAGSLFGQIGQWIGTLEHGDECMDFSATWYEYFTFIRHPFDKVVLILILCCAPLPLVRKNWQSGDIAHTQIIKNVSANMFKYSLNLHKI